MFYLMNAARYIDRSTVSVCGTRGALGALARHGVKYFGTCT